MSKMSLYNIAFKGLSQGKHEFLYELDKSFFGAFENSMVEDGQISVKIILEKRSALLVLWFYIHGTVHIQCDRCLEWFDQPVTGENRIIVKFGEENMDDGDEVIWVSVNDYQLNVAQLMYEFVSLALPIRHVHPDNKNGESTCEQGMIDKLNNLNVCKNGEKDIPDPRWDGLKKLLNNE
ncbi:MAG: DUF177 domain-containing protein [Prolixibacteraceae bacterium]|jgi:uncharacterized metal-binding protein YceD (DUF177 family)|nr:DUF177 domain-containing protein [Prolixibacteraceae bacterium]